MSMATVPARSVRDRSPPWANGSEGTSEAYSFHLTMANFAFGDGSVRALHEDIQIREFAKLVTRAGDGAVMP